MKKIIGSKIQEARKKIRPKMDQGTLGILALGYSENDRNAAQKKISKIEAGTQDATIDELLKIGNVLNIDLKDMIGAVSDLPMRVEKNPPGLSWEIKALIESMQKQIDILANNVAEQKDRIENAASIIRRANNQLANIEKKMDKAAETEDVKQLGASGETG